MRSGGDSSACAMQDTQVPAMSSRTAGISKSTAAADSPRLSGITVETASLGQATMSSQDLPTGGGCQSVSALEEEIERLRAAQGGVQRIQVVLLAVLCFLAAIGIGLGSVALERSRPECPTGGAKYPPSSTLPPHTTSLIASTCSISLSFTLSLSCHSSPLFPPSIQLTSLPCCRPTR